MAILISFDFKKLSLSIDIFRLSCLFFPSASQEIFHFSLTMTVKTTFHHRLKPMAKNDPQRKEGRI